jgi:hypothetical protein
VLTKDNLIKIGWKGSSFCEFCGGYESMNHLFFDYPMARYNWNVVGSIFGVFSRPKNSFELCLNWIP